MYVARCAVILAPWLDAVAGGLGLVSGVVMAAVMVMVLGNFGKGLKERSESPANCMFLWPFFELKFVSSPTTMLCWRVKRPIT